MPALLSPLANRRFSGLFASQLISLLGTGLTSIALALLAYEMNPDSAGLVLGLALTIKMVAYLLVAPIASALTEGRPARPLLSSLNLLRALILLPLPWVDQLWQLLLLIFALNACAAAYTPVFQAMLPDILPDDEEYTRALSLSRLAMELENLASPLLAALLLGFSHYSTLFNLNSLAFLIAACVILLMQLPGNRPVERQQGFLYNTLFGCRAYLKTPRLRAVLGLHLVVSLAGAMVLVNTVVFVREQFGMTEADVAFAMATYGCGAMLAALLIPSLLNVTRDRPVLLSGALISSLALFSGLLVDSWPALLTLWFLLGITNALILVPTGRVIRLSCQPQDRNAYFAANFALSHGCWLIAYPLAGLVGSLSLGSLFLLLALLSLLATGYAWRSWPTTDSLTLEHSHDPLRHQHLHSHGDDHHQHSHEGWEGPEPHSHPHDHEAVRHSHPFSIDEHHLRWPR
ncbi:MFS transporter [Marinobacterium jannaschii]|uniref:MFS transporter n=1 Tax=Marinobacterium jannaschii TaxID=64970 RepID=UPI000ADE277F|nr:MFS transporter [Marinobacterium jannaschii]